MTQTIENREHTDPEGSIFLAKNRFVEQFLALEGDPVELVAMIIADDAPGLEQTLDRLRTSLLLGRGTYDVGPDATDDEITQVIERRHVFYDALTCGIEVLASD